MNNYGLLGRIDENLVEKRKKLDIKDKKILCYLSEDCRIPLTHLKKEIQLSRDGINYRIKNMLKQKLIIQFIPRINFRSLNYYDFHVFFNIHEKNIDEKKEFINYLKSKNYVRKIMEYSGRYSIEIVILAQNIVEFDKYISDLSDNSIIAQKEKMQIIKGYISSHLPKQIFNDVKLRQIRKYKPFEIQKIDSKDMKILKILSYDARIPYYNIAQKINLSGEATKYRIEKLKKNTIRKFSCLVNLSMMNYHWFTVLIKTKKFNSDYEKKLRKIIEYNPNILKVVKTLGSWDFILYIVANNHRHFHETMKEIIHELSETISNYETLLAYKEHMYNPMPQIISKVFNK
ncbi:Lrp/AsnC family transcriptional regulator [archaeon]|jgi:Lrp/AsnC family transcriptional regulator, regulator for asnA, asnC and gidA|nr:Lrp/AsnC family transcriptional regulator [archaeon]MBT4647870.1 Lrp/AsnC family transcriptional regulator [archaeon]MBT6821070.1 Lrp/AsnC family transcriptional regulator [archaeon]MBT7392011.1 Lrp/AsnC family transcriptional regulator [archaeon]